ncbi:MAG: PRC-barrel domain-containing protein [Phycisphaeraceae bacterium]|nr:PRC-barrel domain-containing protein [Phycisphaeraceae bacterium]
MNTNTRRLTACVLASVVGGCFSVAAQPAQEPSKQDQNRQQDPNRQMPPRHANSGDMRTPSYNYASRTYASADKLRGSSIENAAKKDVGSVSDLIIDRGSGAVTYVVVNAGGFLGIGTKKVVVPFTSFGWNAADKQLTLEATSDQVKSWPEYKEETWQGTAESLSNRLSRDYYRTPKNYYPSSSTSDESVVKGKVTKVDRREAPGTNTEEMIVTVRRPDGTDESVIVAPTYYMSGNTNPVYRDAPVEMRVTRVERDGHPVLVARSFQVNASDVPLYDKSGKAHWWEFDKADKNRTIGYPFLLNSDIDGKQIYARGEQCGKVNDLIVETGTGRIAFLSIDPDQNILGIGDTKRLVPWGVAMVITEDSVMLDATKSMITSSPETPSDLSSISGDNRYQTIYQTYGISEPYYYDTNWNNSSRRMDRDMNKRDRDLRDTQPKPK